MIIEYQKIINLFDNSQNEPSKFRTRNWVEINYESWEHIKPVIKLNLKLNWCGQIYVITVIHTCKWNYNMENEIMILQNEQMKE